MNVILSTVGRYHFFALARELERAGQLTRIYSGFPWLALKREHVDKRLVKTFPVLRPVIMGLRYLPFRVNPAVYSALDFASMVAHDHYVARTMERCNVFVGHTICSVEAGRAAKKIGAHFIADSGTSHALWREEMLRTEYDRVGLKNPDVGSQIRSREVSCYGEADIIVVPSKYAFDSFLAKGTQASKLRIIPYGVSLESFVPVGYPSHDHFDVLFVGDLSLGKGAFDLFAAFKLLDVPSKRLTLVGTIAKNVQERFATDLQNSNVRILGHIPNNQLKVIMSAAHVLVLPSIDEGFGMVMAEAMACGCPVIATVNTGARDLYTDGVEGYIVPIRSPDIIASRLQEMAEQRDKYFAMRKQALVRVQSQGKWSHYGEKALATYRELFGNLRNARA